MEICPLCKENIESVKLLKCKFCDNIFCSLGCLIKHASTHLKSNVLPMNIVNSLKRRQSENLTEHFSFLTSGDFNENKEFDKNYSKENFSKVLINNFFPQELGAGSFGHVYLIKHKITNEEFALKEIDKKKLIQMYGKIDIIRNEINIHSKLFHENIIRLYNVYEDENNINFIMEYAKNGNLFELLSLPENNKGLDEQRAFDYFIQVVNAVYYLHQNNIIHRDIKPENILIGKKGLLKLCDFGWAKELTLENRSTFCGTVEYMAPEIVGSENYDYSVDIWSLGILLYELVFGHSPFKAKNMKNVILNIKNHDLTYDKHISYECKNLIKKILNINPQKRIKIKDILIHPFVQKYSKNYINRKILEFNYDTINSDLYINNNNKIKNNNFQINFNTSSKKEINKKIEDDDNQNFIMQRSNTKYFEAKTKSIFKNFKNNESNKFETPIKKEQKIKINFKKNNSLSCFNNGNIKKAKTSKDIHQTEKKLLYIEKIRDSFFVELKKMRKKIDSISFKNTECCTFEDVRDVQLSNQKQKYYNENGKGKIKKISLEGVFNKFKSSNNIVPNIYNTETKIKPFKEYKKNNKEDSDDGEIDDLFDNEEKAMIERLNKAYKKFGKDNENSDNDIKIQTDRSIHLKNKFLSYE